MYINAPKELIEMSDAEYKAAMTYGTKEYAALREIRSDYPKFRPVVIKPKKGKASQDKLNMASIKSYVKAHGSAEQKAEFLLISTPNFTEDGVYIPQKSFFEIQKWFLAQFPEYNEAMEDYETKIQRIFDAVEKKIEDAKAKAAEEARAKAEKEAAEFLAAS